MKTEYEKMISGSLYSAGDGSLVALATKGRLAIERYNRLSRLEKNEKYNILKATFREIGDKCHIESPLHVDYGINISIGNNFYANYDCIFLDVAPIKIGHNVMFGPRVSLYTATHPLDFEVRNGGLEYGLPITIGDNCWLGGNVVVNPGITIGKNSIIASGSIVTKDIPENVIAGGNPCRVIRELTEKDKQYWKERENNYYKNKI